MFTVVGFFFEVTFDDGDNKSISIFTFKSCKKTQIFSGRLSSRILVWFVKTRRNQYNTIKLYKLFSAGVTNVVPAATR